MLENVSGEWWCWKRQGEGKREREKGRGNEGGRQEGRTDLLLGSAASYRMDMRIFSTASTSIMERMAAFSIGIITWGEQSLHYRSLTRASLISLTDTSVNTCMSSPRWTEFNVCVCVCVCV